MEGVWDKLDGYTKSDSLESSDDAEEFRRVSGRKKIPSLSSENSLPSEDNVESGSENVESEKGSNLQESLLNEMRKSKLHNNNEPRNTQDKVDQISANKKKQKEELSEMQDKAQVISRGARMSAADVLSSITNTETDFEDSNEKEEYYLKIQSVHTESKSVEVPAKDLEGTSPSSDTDLPKILGGSTVVLNVGVMKSKASIARQGSMKARRKPTAMSKKSWTPGLSEVNMSEKDETTAHDDDDKESEIWVTSRVTGGEKSVEKSIHTSDSFTPSDSSSEEEKEVTKPPHLRSGIALPGLGDALKIQMQKSELKRPTALNLVQTAKDSKENEVAKEDRTEIAPSKPQWMKEVEERKKTSRSPRRKHMTLSGPCSELDKVFEKRRNLRALEGLAADADQSSRDQETVARESPRPKSFPGDDVDPELNKLLERRRNLTPVEGITTDEERSVQEPDPTNTHSFKPRNVHLVDRQCSELDKVFEKRSNLRPVEGERTDVEQARLEEQSMVAQSVKSTNFNLDDQTKSGIVRARIHDGHSKLEPLQISATSQLKVATRQTHHKDTFPGQADANQATVFQAGQVAEFVFDGKGADRAMLGCIPPASSQKPIGYPDESDVDHVGEAVTKRYDSQPRYARAMNQSRSNKDIYPNESAVTADFSGTRHLAPVRSFTQERTPIYVDLHSRRPAAQTLSSPKGSATSVRYLPSEPQSNMETLRENRMPVISSESSISDTRSFVEQLSMKPFSHYNHDISQAKSSRRVPSMDNSVERVSYVSPANELPERVLYSERTCYEDIDSYKTSSKSFHRNQRLPSNSNPNPNPINAPHPIEETDTLPGSRSFSHLPKHQILSNNLPPLNPNKSPPPAAKSPVSKSPEVLNSQTVRNPQQRHNESMQSRTFKESFVVSPTPDKLRKVTSPVGSPAFHCNRNSNSFVSVENEVFANRVLENGQTRVKSPLGSYSSSGQSIDLGRQNLEHPKPVTITVKTMSKSVQRLPLKENETLDVGGNMLPPVVNGNIPRRNEVGRSLKGRSGPQSSDSPAVAPGVPKWKQELMEKKRLQRGKQNMSGHIVQEKGNIKPEQSGNDMAEWQRRLKGIRKSWSEHEDSRKNNKDNVKEESKSDEDSKGERKLPAFLKEYKAQKRKKTVKVTVTATSTPSQQDAERVNLNEDQGSSSNHERGTYV